VIDANDAKHLKQLLRHLAENPATEETIVFFADNNGMLQSCNAILSRYHGGNREVREWVDKECASKGVSPTFLLQEAARVHQLFGADERENLDHYLVLGLSAASASPEAIKRAYRRLCAQYHPDTSRDPGPQATEKFIAINRAYHALMAEVPEAESKPTGTTAASWNHRCRHTRISRNISTKLLLAGVLALAAVGASLFIAHLYSRQAMLTALRNRSEAFVPPSERPAPEKDLMAPLTLHEKLRQGLVTIPEEPSARDDAPPSEPLVTEIPTSFSATVSSANKAQPDGPVVGAIPAEPTTVGEKEKPVVLLPADQHKVKTETTTRTIPPAPLPVRIEDQGEKANTIPAAAPPAVAESLAATRSPEQESLSPSSLQQQLDDFLDAYCRAYGAQDLEAFSRFFDLAAIENGKPFLELRDTYSRLFASTRERTLAISSRQWKEEGNHIHLHGQFTITLIYDNEETVHGAGTIEFLLANNRDNLQIKTMNYSFKKR
jgi:hypothetical protein